VRLMIFLSDNAMAAVLQFHGPIIFRTSRTKLITFPQLQLLHNPQWNRVTAT
jgi:hypothetical protein